VESAWLAEPVGVGGKTVGLTEALNLCSSETRLLELASRLDEAPVQPDPMLEMSVCDELLDDELQEEDDENPDEVEEAVDGGAEE